MSAPAHRGVDRRPFIGGKLGQVAAVSAPSIRECQWVRLAASRIDACRATSSNSASQRPGNNLYAATSIADYGEQLKVQYFSPADYSPERTISC